MYHEINAQNTHNAIHTHMVMGIMHIFMFIVLRATYLSNVVLPSYVTRNKYTLDIRSNGSIRATATMEFILHSEKLLLN